MPLIYVDTKEAEEAYREATVVAKSHLTTTDPCTLALALNYSVFYYEIRNMPDKACEIAKKVS